VPLPPNPWLSNGTERIEFTAYSPDAGRRLDQFLVAKLPWRSRTGIQKMLAEGRVSIAWPENPATEEKADKASIKLRPGARIAVETPVPRIPPPANLAELQSQLEVIYEDEWLVAVNKPPFMAAHPAGRFLYGTLISILSDRYRNEDPEKDIIPHLCHRIDRETSGAIVSSKSDQVRHKLGRQFEDRRVEKNYLAIVEGEMKDDETVVDMALDRDYSSPVRVKMGVVKTGGQHALTRFHVVERVPGYTLVLCKPLTGRQHQIRVHLAAIGHPIVGDKLYGPTEQFFVDYIDGRLSEESQRRLILGRQALHAFNITFTHPVHAVPLTIEAPLAADMRDFLQKAKEGRLHEIPWSAPEEHGLPEPE
jgi:23S rRNA pseudouridine1911/1915/1917 synthase